VSLINKEQQSYPSNWQELDHPFYVLCRDILGGKGAIGLTEPSQLKPDQEFWGLKAPKEIIIATGSTRKAYMLSIVLNGIEVPLAHPMDFQQFIVDAIHNGDGALKTKTFLGGFNGVPVYAESAASGETAANFPQAEAINKAMWLSDQPQYQGDDYLIVSTDTVDFLDRDGNGRISAGEEGLGKPMNHPDFPSKNSLMKLKNSWLKFLGEKIHLWQISEFEKQYAAENFEGGKNLVHTNAIALLELFADGSEEVVRLWDVILKSEIDEDFFSKYSMVPDQGGGGASQQNQNWESTEELLDTLDSETRNIMEKLAGEEPEFFKFLVIFQISGMPAMSILHEIERLAESRKNSGLSKEVVVFEHKDS